MSGRYVINIGNASAKQWTQFNFEHTLNGMSTGTIALDGVTQAYFDEFDVGSEIKIYKGGTLKFRGEIIDQNIMSGGGLILPCVGIEIELNDSKAPMSVATDTKRVWTSTSDNTIFNTLITSVTGWTTNVTNSTSITLSSFRVPASMSVWDSIIKMITETGKDIWVDQENKVVYLYDELTRDEQFVYIEGKNARDISRKKSRSKAGKVIVYGKGDGDFQVTGSFGSGTPVHLKIDRNIIDNSSADDMAEALYNKLNPNPKRYSFSPTIPNDSLRVGDSGKLINNPFINDVVDITRQKITVDNNGTEKIRLEVTNPDFRIASKNIAEESVKNRINFNESQSSMQGSGNLSQYQAVINGNNTYGLTSNFYIGDFFFDEADNNKIDAILIDYQLDAYRSDIGTASESNRNPNIDINTFSNDDNESTQPLENDDEISPANITTSATSIWNVTPNADGEAIIFFINANVVDTNSTSLRSLYVRIKDTTNTDYYPSVTGLRLLRSWTEQDTSTEGYHRHTPAQTAGLRLWFDCTDMDDIPSGYNVQYTSYNGDHEHLSYSVATGNASIYIPINPNGISFSVQLYTSAGTLLTGAFVAYYVISQHKHGRGTYRTDLHRHDVSISSNFEDEAGINATGGTAYLELWNTTTEVWDTKVTKTLTDTLQLEEDMSDGGTYPNERGWWRIRIVTNDSSPDLIKCVTSIKHSLDN